MKGYLIIASGKDYVRQACLCAMSIKHTQTVTNNNIFRLPGGYQAKAFHIVLQGTDAVNEVCVYESPGEIT